MAKELLENLAKCECLGASLTNQITFTKRFKQIKWGILLTIHFKAFCLTVSNLKIQILNTHNIHSLFSMGVKPGISHSKDDHELQKVYTEEGEWRKLLNMMIHNLYLSPYIILYCIGTADF
jgi:hypothetical protein